MQCKPIRTRKGCLQPFFKAITLEGMVREFINEFRTREKEELAFFRNNPWPVGLEFAALAKDPEGKRFSHQRRLTRLSLNQAKDAIFGMQNVIRSASSFESVHSTLRGICNDIVGLGELYAYDTALRISAALGFAPMHVHLHAGTRVGAKKLGLSVGEGYLHLTSLPKALAPLLAHEVESFLCIYKNRFGSITTRRA